MARKKTRLQEEIEEILQAAAPVSMLEWLTDRQSQVPPEVEEVDPRLAPLATLREQLPPGDPEPRCPATLPTTRDSTSTAQGLEEALRRLQEQAQHRRQEAEARKAEADTIRRRLEELAQERRRLEGVVRRAQALVGWAPPEEARAIAEEAQARIEAVEAEMRDLAFRLQELEADEGVRHLREEEAARQAQEEAARKAEEARALLRQGKVAEAIRHVRRAIRQAGGPTPTSLAQALEEALRIARRVAGNAYFRAREALAGGDPARAMREAEAVADLLRHIPVADRRPLHGVFCQAAAALAKGQPLVLVRGRRTQRGWTAPPGAIAVGIPQNGGARVLFNLGTPWREGETVPESAAHTEPLRAQQP